MSKPTTRGAGIVLLLGLGSCFADPGDAEIRVTFASYQDAIRSRNGEQARQLVDSETIAYHDSLRVWALTASRIELEALPVIDRLQALLTRVRIPEAELQGMAGDVVFRRFVDEGWIRAEAVDSMVIGEITFSDGNTARAKLDQRSQSLLFKRENGAWKLSLVYITQVASRHLRQEIQRMGSTEREFIMGVLESELGGQVPDSVWDKVPSKP